MGNYPDEGGAFVFERSRAVEIARQHNEQRTGREAAVCRCYLNRKPYRDRDGIVRQRGEELCCQRRDNCLLEGVRNQPRGEVIG